MKRSIINIDRKKCIGCGLCTRSCAEGALEIDSEGKARLVKEIYCDGLGKCLDVCPVGALKIVEEEAPAFNRQEAEKHAKETGHRFTPSCPGCQTLDLKPSGKKRVSEAVEYQALQNWPVQLRLVSPAAPFLKECELLIAADCTAFAKPDFHALLKGKVCLITCPKLTDYYEEETEKLGLIIKENNIAKVTLAIMEVPCCRGLERLVNKAIDLANVNVALEVLIVPIQP